VEVKGMFMGEYQHTIDEKGRIIVPLKFREGLGEKFIVTRGIERCLYTYSMDQWEIVSERFRSLNSMQPGARFIQRSMISGAHECELDKQGRILLPHHLREYSVLEKECVVLGVNNHVEIWSKSKWTEYFDTNQQEFYETAGKLLDFSITL
jgi:MraZ protein